MEQKEIQRIRDLEKKYEALNNLVQMLKILVRIDKDGPTINPDRKYAEPVQSEFWT